MEKSYGIIGMIILGLAFMACSALEKEEAKEEVKKDELTLVWSDEFDYSGLPDSTKWSFDVGNGCDAPPGCGWGNNELQFYTKKDLDNAYVSNGHLVIKAIKEKIGDREYSSARLVTKGKGDWKFGRLKIKAKLPKGRGLWAAIWMLSTEDKYKGWPNSGEIDIMEYVGYLPDTIYGTVHTKSYNGMIGTQKGGNIFDADIGNEFHEYQIDWTPDQIKWYMDDVHYFTFENDGKDFKGWPFDEKFHLIMNLTIGGNWGGKQGIDESVFPQKMEVDYVRVYQ